MVNRTALRYITRQYGKIWWVYTDPYIMLTYCLPGKLTAVKNGFQGAIKHQGSPIPRLCSSLLCTYSSKKLPEWIPTKTRLCAVHYATTCVGTSTRHLWFHSHSSPVFASVDTTMCIQCLCTRADYPCQLKCDGYIQLQTDYTSRLSALH